MPVKLPLANDDPIMSGGDKGLIPALSEKEVRTQKNELFGEFAVVVLLARE